MVQNETYSKLCRAVKEDPENLQSLQDLYSCALAGGMLDHAGALLGQLQQQQPWNHHIRKLLIALDLQQKDYPAAMAGVETLVAFSKPDKALIDSALAVRKHMGPITIKAGKDRAGSLSLCMIIKNERDFLGPCLNSVKDLVDEIVVVDTGSTDVSADIARIFGARVYRFKWCDDFSAARNISLEKAQGDWILILDADEIIAPRDHAAIRRIVDNPTAAPKAYSFQTRNYSNLANAIDWRANDGSYPRQETALGWFPTGKVRLFPRSESIRFVYPVHELVDPSIKAQGLPISASRIPIHHYGQLNEAKNTQKALHYFELGYSKLEQLGNDMAALRELAVQAGRLERWRESIELWHRLLGLKPDYDEALANLSGAYWQTGQYEQGISYAQKAIKANSGMKEGHFNLAVNLIMSGRPEKGAEILQSITKRHPQYLAAHFMLAAALVLSGEDEESRPIFKNLEKKMSEEVLSIAIKDLAEKLARSGAAGYCEKLLKQAV